MEIAGGTWMSGAGWGDGDWPGGPMSPGHHTAKGSSNCWCFLFKPKSSCSQSLLGVKCDSTLYLCCASLLTVISRDFQASSCCVRLASCVTHHPTAPRRVVVLELVLHQPCGKCLHVFRT